MCSWREWFQSPEISKTNACKTKQFVGIESWNWMSLLHEVLNTSCRSDIQFQLSIPTNCFVLHTFVMFVVLSSLLKSLFGVEGLGGVGLSRWNTVCNTCFPLESAILAFDYSCYESVLSLAELENETLLLVSLGC